MIEIEIERGFERIDSMAKSLFFRVAQGQRFGNIGESDRIVADVLMGDSYGIKHIPPISIQAAF